jgi:hypothetical protein
MRFMLMHKVTEAMEQGLPPTPEAMQEIGKLMGEASQAGALISGEGLKPTSQRWHVAYKNGKRKVTKGPFSKLKELAGGYILLRVVSQEDALGWLDRFAALFGDIELFLGPVVEPWDMGMGDKPDGAPMRFLAVYNADASLGEPSTDSEALPSLRILQREMAAAGVLQESAVLAPPREGARLRYESGKLRVIDGPFAESKELIAGYAMFEVASKAEALDWAIRFGNLGGIEEIDVRLVRE